MRVPWIGKKGVGCLALVFAALSVGAAIPVIYDSDMGGDLDDTWALLYMLKCPELEVKLVTTSDNLSEYRTKHFAKILEISGQTHVPIGKGKDFRADVDYYAQQRGWVEDYDLSAYKGTVHEDGINEMIRIIMESDVPVTILAVGPQQNIAEALRREPRIAINARLVCMGGKLATDENPAHNVVRAPEAFAEVLAAPWQEILICPKESCSRIVLEAEAYQQVYQSKRPELKALMQNYDIWLSYLVEQWPIPRDKYTFASTTLWDVEPVLAAFDPSPLKWKAMQVTVDEIGRFTEDANGAEVKMAVDWTDYAAFEKEFIRRLIGDFTQ